MEQSLVILMLVTRRQKRGAEVSAANLSRKFIEKGHKVLWVGLYAPGDDVLEVEGAVNIDLKEGNGFLNFTKIQQLRRIIDSHHVNVIQANGSDNLRYAIAAKTGFKKLVLVYRNISLVSFWIGNNILKRLFYGILMRFVDHVVSVGEASRNDFIKTYLFPPDRISVIHRGIPFVNLDKSGCRKKVCLEFSIPEDSKLLIWAGALSSEKNPMLMLDIMNQLGKDGAYYLLVVGKGELEQTLWKKAISSELRNVYFTGYRSDLPQLLAAADLLVLTSNIEGVPGVVLEAAVCRTSSICSDVGGVREAVLDGKTGILLKNTDAAAYCKSIKMLWEQSDLLNELANNAYQYVREEFEENNMSNSFLNLFMKGK